MSSQSPTERDRVNVVMRLAWLPIPLLLAAIITTRAVGLRGTYELPTLRLVLSFIFYTLVSLGTLFLIGRSFLSLGTPGLLLLECGVILWSLAGTVGDIVWHGDENVNVTIFNAGILLAGMCHLAGAVFALRPQHALRAKWLWLAVGCAASLGTLALITWAALGGRLPVFFIPGQGGTPMRYCVLITAIATLVLSAGLLRVGQRHARLPFASWYALALLTLAVGLFGIMIQFSIGSIVNWLARSAQWLGGAYLLVAAVAALRESNLPLFPLEQKARPAYYRDAVAVAIVLAAAAVRLVFLQALGTSHPFLTFYPAVMLAALYGGQRAGLLATVLSAVIADYFWFEPVHQFAFGSVGDVLSLGIFLACCTMISSITEAMLRARVRVTAAEAEARAAAERERAADELRATLESIRDGFFACDADWRFVYVNGTAERLLDIRREEVLGKHHWEVFPLTLGTPLEREYRRAAAGEARDFESFYAPWGRWFHNRCFPRAGGGMSVYFADITERKQAEEALRQARNGLEAQVQERTAELRQAIERLKRENEERLRSEQSLQLERARLDALLRLSQMSDASVAEMTGFVLEHGIALTASRIGFVGFVSEDEAVYTLHAVSKEVVKECNVAGNPVEWHVTGAGIWADAIREHRTLIVNDYSQVHRTKKGLPPGHLPIQRFMVVPAFDGERVAVVAGVGNKGRDYDESDARQISLLLSGLWSCVERNRAREALQKARDELEQRVKERTAELAVSNVALQEEIAERKRAEDELRQLNENLERRVLERTAELDRTVGQLQAEAEQRIQAQTSLRESEERYRSLFEANPDAVLLVETPAGRIVDVNPGALRLYGYSREQMLSRTLGDLSGDVCAAQELARAKASSPFTISSNHTRSDGTGFPVDLTVCRLTAADGDWACFIVRDTTEAQRAAQLARAYQERLQSLVLDLSLAEARERRRVADELHDTIGQLLFLAKAKLTLSTEPCTASGPAENTPEAVQLLDRAHQACRSLINELGNPALHELGISAAADKLAEEVEQVFGLKVHLKDDGQPKPIDPLRATILLRCVREALVNASKHAGVTEAHLHLRRLGDRACVVVEDKGVGFDVSRLGLAGSAGGFGLFSVRERIEGLGGSVEIESAPNQGTTVCIELPMANDTFESREALR